MLSREDLYAWLTIYEFRQMESFLELLHKAIIDSREQLDAELENPTASEEYRAFLHDTHDSDVVRLEEDFPRLLFSNFIASWYSLVERHLIGFCSVRNLKITIAIEDRDNYGTGIQRAHKFLQQATGYTIDNESWKELNRIRDLRNIIVHNQGRLDYSVKDALPKRIPVTLEDDELVYLELDTYLLHYLQSHKLLRRAGQFRWLYIMPTFEYCRHLVKFGEEFF